MDTQEACEVLEGLLHHNIKNRVLSMKEFLALNKVLLDLSCDNKYIVPEKYILKVANK